MLSLYQGKVDGIYNETTEKAVRIFQDAEGLPVDGIVRYHIWLKLHKKLEELSLKQPSSSPAPAGEISLVIDTFRRRLIVFGGGEPFAQFPVAIGETETPSPIGSWKVVNKAKHWGTGFGTRWLGLNVSWGSYGIHGTNKPWTIGTRASHGCFRMFNRDVETIYPWIKVGTPVYVIGNPFWYAEEGLKAVGPGFSGYWMVFIQKKLARRGYYQGEPTGFYDRKTLQAVKALQKELQLKETGIINFQLYEHLGIKENR